MTTKTFNVGELTPDEKALRDLERRAVTQLTEILYGLRDGLRELPFALGAVEALTMAVSPCVSRETREALDAAHSQLMIAYREEKYVSEMLSASQQAKSEPPAMQGSW